MACLLAAICLYVLSIGPVYSIGFKTHPSKWVWDAIDLFYKPVKLLARHSKGFSTVLYKYFTFCGCP